MRLRNSKNVATKSTDRKKLTQMNMQNALFVQIHNINKVAGILKEAIYLLQFQKGFGQRYQHFITMNAQTTIPLPTLSLIHRLKSAELDGQVVHL